MKLRKTFFVFVYSITLCFAICNATDSNQCSGGQYQSECITGSILIGKPCTQSSQCVEFETGKSECADIQPNGAGVCRCLKDFVGSSDNRKCLSKDVQIGRPCEESVQCVEFEAGKSQCTNDLCTCEDGLVGSSDHMKCVPENVEIGKECEDPLQCVEFELGKSNCTEGYCRCNEGLVGSEDNQRCITKGLLIGEPCDESRQCAMGDDTSVCTESGYCDCITNYVPSNNLARCLPYINTLNQDVCEEKQQCQAGSPGVLSDCVLRNNDERKVCKCTTDAVNEDGKHVCYRKASVVGDPCQINAQCTTSLGQSLCVSNHCECNPGSIESTDKKKCLKSGLSLGDKCEDLNQCSHIEFANCTQDQDSPESGLICKCNGGYVNPEGKDICYSLATVVGGTCSSDPIQCSLIENSVCNVTNDGLVCVCKDKHIENENRNKCLGIIESLNETCEESIQCKVPGSECNSQTNQCRCVENIFVESNVTRDKCVPIRYEINLNCSEPIQCTTGLGDLAGCIDDICQCKHSYGYYNGKCYIPAHLGIPCYQDEQCHVGVNNLTECSVSGESGIRKCKCKQDTIAFPQTCYEVKQIGDPCKGNDECTVSIVGEVQCDSNTKTCSCKPGYLPYTGYRECSGSLSLHQFSGMIPLVILFGKLIEIYL